MLLDAHSLIYRAWFALYETPLTTSKGQLVNAAFGFWSIVLRGFADMQPDHVMCCFDVGRSFRADRYEDYKATRKPTPDDLRDQFPIVRETLDAFAGTSPLRREFAAAPAEYDRGNRHAVRCVGQLRVAAIARG